MDETTDRRPGRRSAEDAADSAPPSDATRKLEPEEVGASTPRWVPGPQPPAMPGYALLQRLGAGGMGEVWEAEQREPVRRRVAIKFILPGIGTETTLARFEVERQALASMDHPAIAKVFDAGTAADGRPYFVMEMVAGTDIVQYSDRHHLGLRQRLRLFLQVCAGVEHAHQRAILHRDLKPSNILVTAQDGAPVPKIIDFGLAKATAQPLTEHTLFTRRGDMMGTPEYMSPEQAQIQEQGVDTRTDVYSLGMVLYVLLVGALPFDRRALKEMGLVQIQQRILNEEPPRPSRRASRLGDAAELAAANRGMNRQTLARVLQGDLDWVVMKALEKEPDRRYGSVRAFAADIERYLEDRTVEARPPTSAYRLRKFVRRHTLEVVAAAVVLLALVTGAAFATLGLLQARSAEREAVLQAEAADQVTEFLVGIFDVADPGQARGRTVTAREILKRGSEELAELDEQPFVQGRLQHTVGRVFNNLGLYDDSEPLLAAAVSTLRDSEGERARRELQATLHNLGVLYGNQGRYPEAEAIFRELLSDRRSTDPGEQRHLARNLNSLGAIYWNQGKYAQAAETLERALEVRKRIFGVRSIEVAKSFSNLGTLAHSRDSLREAEDFLISAQETYRKLPGGDHPDLAGTLNNLGSLYQEQRRFGEARRAFEEALAIWEKVLGSSHPDVGIALHNLGDLAQAESAFEEALSLYRRARTIWQETLTTDHTYFAFSHQAEASARHAAGDLEGAEALYRQALESWKRAAGEDHPSAADALEGYAELLDDLGRPREAEALRARRAAAAG